MRNRAKCRLCNDIIESYHATDYVVCKCDEIAVSDGQGMKCAAKDFKNFIRVDDEGNEIITRVIGDTSLDKQPGEPPNRNELLEMLEGLIKGYDNLPQHALLKPVNHADMQSALMIIYAILRDR